MITDQFLGIMIKPHLRRRSVLFVLPYTISCPKVYPLEYIISDAELKAISIDKTALDVLPFRRSTWINNHVKRRATKPGKAEKLEL